MIEIKIKTKGVKEALRNLAAFDRIAKEENRQAMEYAVREVERVAKMNAPVNFGFLRSKIGGEVKDSGPGTVVGVVGSYAPYGQVVEEGADPHWPNIRGLGLWVMRKFGLRGKSLDRVTFLIGRAISRRGLRARPYLMPAVEKSQNKIRRFFENAMENIARRLAG